MYQIHALSTLEQGKKEQEKHFLHLLRNMMYYGNKFQN